jgi:hypothetical protein
MRGFGFGDIERTTGSLRKAPITLAREKDYSPILSSLRLFYLSCKKSSATPYNNQRIFPFLL